MLGFSRRPKFLLIGERAIRSKLVVCYVSTLMVSELAYSFDQGLTFSLVCLCCTQNLTATVPL